MTTRRKKLSVCSACVAVVAALRQFLQLHLGIWCEFKAATALPQPHRVHSMWHRTSSTDSVRVCCQHQCPGVGQVPADSRSEDLSTRDDMYCLLVVGRQTCSLPDQVWQTRPGRNRPLLPPTLHQKMERLLYWSCSAAYEVMHGTLQRLTC